MSRRALFLDRDGVINEDRGYCHRIEDFAWVDGIFDTVRTANALGFAVIVVTNQAGIARGYYTERDFQRLTDWMRTEFEAAHAPIASVYYCPHHPEGMHPYNIVSPNRKPAPGMLLQAAADHRLELARSLLIGDQESDILAGRAAGLAHTALFAPHGVRPTTADTVLAGHGEACEWITRLAAAPTRAARPARA
jgi:D-glycero-D-manno-heptose 1,7-bisphosphate phosphatase